MASSSSSSRFARLSEAFRRYPYLRFGLTVAAWVPVAIQFSLHVYSVAEVGGESMQPTFNPNLQMKPLHKDVVLLQKWSGRYHRGDVITFWSPTNPDQLTVKRIVALEGDIVQPLPPHRPRAVKIPPGHAWVEGDSTYRTRDSNTFGPISLSLVDARVSYILWPFKRISEVSRGPGKSEGRVKKLGPDWVDTH